MDQETGNKTSMAHPEEASEEAEVALRAAEVASKVEEAVALSEVLAEVSEEVDLTLKEEKNSSRDMITSPDPSEEEREDLLITINPLEAEVVTS